MANDSANFLVGFMVGTAFGGMVALLLAPASGKKLRRDIGRQGRKLAHRASEAAEQARDKGTDLYERARGGVA